MSDQRNAAGIHAARLRLYGSGGLGYNHTDVEVLRRCMELDGITELTLVPDPFGYDVDSRFRIDEGAGLMYVPRRLGLIVEAALSQTGWGTRVTSLDLHLRAVL